MMILVRGGAKYCAVNRVRMADDQFCAGYGDINVGVALHPNEKVSTRTLGDGEGYRKPQ